jgi:hypothetical protein
MKVKVHCADFLSDVFVLANVLNDISNFETGQILVQNNSQTVAVTNTPTLNTFRIGYNNNINHK